MDTLLASNQIIIACSLGALAGTLYYAIAFKLLRRSKPASPEASEDDSTVAESHPALLAIRNSKATDDAVARFISELQQPDKTTGRRMTHQ